MIKLNFILLCIIGCIFLLECSHADSPMRVVEDAGDGRVRVKTIRYRVVTVAPTTAAESLGLIKSVVKGVQDLGNSLLDGGAKMLGGEGGLLGGIASSITNLGKGILGGAAQILNAGNDAVQGVAMAGTGAASNLVNGK